MVYNINTTDDKYELLLRKYTYLHYRNRKKAEEDTRMAKNNVLIITPYSDFGAIINQSLSNDPSLNINVASTKKEIQAYLKNKLAYDHALLDLDLGESKVLELGFSLRGKFPNIEIILISKKEPSLGMDELRPWKLLRKPFVQSDLDSIFQDGKNPSSGEPQVIDLNFKDWVDVTPHAWWEDEIRVTKTLVTAISDMDVQEAILFSSEDILARAGKMDGAAVEECSKLVGNIKLGKDTSEILKPIQLKTTRTNHFIHATILAVGILLALLYDAETPLKDIRVQSRHLTQILKNPQLSNPEGTSLPTTPKVRLEDKQTASETEAGKTANLNRGASRTHHPRLIMYSNRFRKQQKETDLLSKVEGPGSFQESQMRAELKPSPFNTPDPGNVREPNPGTGRIEIHLPPEEQQKSDWLQDTLQWMGASVQGSKQERHFSLCSPEFGLVDLNYACLLIPRLKSQSLDGDITDFLKEALPELFLANGWRLEAMDIGPSFLQWLVKIPPTIAPADHISTVRMQSSHKILGNLARLNRDELLKDFWAPGYLLGSGQSLFQAEDIIEFIRLNRKHYYPDESVYSIPGSKYQVNHSKY